MREDPVISSLLAAIVSILRERRTAAGISKKRLAQAAGVTRTAIILMEKSERMPSLELALRLSGGLGVPLSEIVKEAESRLGADGDLPV